MSFQMSKASVWIFAVIISFGVLELPRIQNAVLTIWRGGKGGGKSLSVQTLAVAPPPITPNTTQTSSSFQGIGDIFRAATGPHAAATDGACRKLNFTPVSADWEAGEQGRGFRYDPAAQTLRPVKVNDWQVIREDHKRALFYTCLHEQMRFIMQHEEPQVLYTHETSLHKTVRAKLKEMKRSVTLAIFWGRKRYLTILLPYIVRQLRSQGGIADKLFIGLNTAVPEDIQLAHELEGKYGKEIEILPVPMRMDALARYNFIWAKLWGDKNHIVVRIDDDLTFIEDSAIEQLVLAKLLNPKHTAISANIINTDKIPQLHQRMGAWTPPPEADTQMIAKLIGEANEAAYRRLAPFEFYGVTYRDPLQALSQHRSLISRIMSRGNLSKAEFKRHVGCVLEAYKFHWFDMTMCRCTEPQVGYRVQIVQTAGEPLTLPNCSPSGAWRWSINLFVVDPQEVKLKAFSAEEPFFSSHVPTVLKRRTAVLGSAIAVHAMYTPQRKRALEIEFDEEALFLKDYRQIAHLYN